MSLPYFPMYPSDFEAKTSHLTIAEDGAYNRLLRICWMTPGCSMPDDEAWIMRRARAHTEADKEAVRAVLAEFFAAKDGRFSNARLTREWLAANEAHERRKNAGAKGGKAKALKLNNTGPSNDVAKPKQPEPEPEEVDKSTSQEAVFYQRYLKAHPKPVESSFGEERFHALIIAGRDPEQIIGAAEKYAETVKAWSPEAKVQQSDNFLCEVRGKWLNYIPPAKATDAEVLDFYAEIVRKKAPTARITVNRAMAERLVAASLVTPEQLTDAGVDQ